MLNNINLSKERIVFGKDSIVVQKYIAGIPGGRTLDVTGVTESHINAGHVIARKADGTYYPLGVKDGAYVALPENNTYAGVLVSSVSVKDPEAAILIEGVVNKAVLPYPLPAAFLTAFPTIVHVQDEEA